MFALGGVAKDIMYTIHFETILLKSCDFFLRKKASEHCYKHGTVVVQNTGMSKVLGCI